MGNDMLQKNVWKQIGTALAVSALVTMVFLLCVAFFMLKCGLGADTVEKLMLAGYVLAPATGGFLLGKKQKVNRFLWGAAVGALYFLLYALLAVCLNDAAIGDVLWVMIPVCLGGTAGGMLS